MLTLGNLAPKAGSTRDKKRIGRGQGSGQGGTAGRGHKGAKARSGSGIKPGFEGGQMPLQRRLPKRGFNNVFKKQYTIVSLADLEGLSAGSRVDHAALVAAGIISRQDKLIKVLANGEISKAITLAVDKVSAAARQKIVAAGGSVEE